jgi:transposase
VAYRQNGEAVEEFLKREYPEIKKEAKKYGARIYWGDESAIRSDYHSGTTWAPKGQTPVIKTTGARFSVNMLSAISSKGHIRFMVTEKNGTIPVFIEFLKRPAFKQKKPVYPIVDGHPVHKSKKVKDYVESTDGKLKLFYLPGYSPELNPDETVWSYVKHHVIGKKIITGPEQFLKVVKEALYSLMHKPTIISAFFRKPSLQYILYMPCLGSVEQFKGYLLECAVRNGYGRYEQTILVSDGRVGYVTWGKNYFPMRCRYRTFIIRRKTSIVLGNIFFRGRRSSIHPGRKNL